MARRPLHSRWTDEEDLELRRMLMRGASAAAIGVRLKRSAAAVRHRGRVLGFAFERGRPVRSTSDEDQTETPRIASLDSEKRV